jgi:hypothetical protein
LPAQENKVKHYASTFKDFYFIHINMRTQNGTTHSAAPFANAPAILCFTQDEWK